jgi:hypothetical protein
MSKLTLCLTLFCAAILFAVSVAPASAKEAPKSRLHCVERADSANADTAKVAFLQSLAQGLGNKKPAKSPQKPFESKVARTECTSDGPMTTCCGACGCCTWTGDGNGPRCVSNC